MPLIEKNLPVLQQALVRAGARSVSLHYATYGGEAHRAELEILWADKREELPERVWIELSMDQAHRKTKDRSAPRMVESRFDEVLEILCEQALATTPHEGFEDGRGTLCVESTGSARLEHYSPTEDQTDDSTEIVVADLEGAPILSGTAKALLDAMNLHGIQQVEVQYSGSGDSSNAYEVLVDGNESLATIGEIVRPYLRREWDTITKTYSSVMDETTESFEDAAIALADILIEHCGHNGYENCEGGSGTVTLMETGIVRLDHHDYFESEEKETYDFGSPAQQAVQP